MAAGYYSYQLLGLSSTPSRYFRMNEASGTVAYDYSNFLSNGTYTGGFTLAQASLINDTTGASAKPNGTTGYIAVNGSPGLPASNNTFTIICWGQLSANPGIKAALAWFGSATTKEGVHFGVQTTGVPYVSTASVSDANGSTAVTLNSPFMLAMTWDGTNQVGYIGQGGTLNQFATQATGPLNIIYGSAAFGALSNTSSNFWTGLMAEGAVLTTNLSITQLRALYNAGVNGAPSVTSISTNLDFYSFAAHSLNPLREYHLDDVGYNPGPSNVATDFSGQGQNGTYSGNIFFGQPALTNNLDSSVNLNGAGYVSVPTAGLPTANQPFTMLAWCNAITFADAGGFKFLVTFGSDGASGANPWLGFSNTGVPMTGNFSTNLSGPSAVPTGTTHMLAVTWDGTHRILYLDGLPIASDTPAAMTITLLHAAIGAYGAGTQYFWNGLIDEAIILNYAVSAVLLRDLYNHGLGLVGASIGANSPYSMKTQIVRVFNPSGAFLDLWHDAPLLSGFKEAVNSAPTPIKVKLPRKFDFFDEAGFGQFGTIGQGNIVQWWLYGPGLPPTGLLRYQGIIDSYQQDLSESSEETITVSVTPYGATVGDGGITTTVAMGVAGNASTYVDPLAMMRYFFYTNDPDTSLPYFTPLSLDPATPISSGNASQYTWQNQGLDTVLDTVRLLLPVNYYWRIDQNTKMVLMAVPPTTAQHTFTIGENVSAPSFKHDWEQLRNVVQVIGNPTTIVAVKKGTDIATYGKRLQSVSDNRVTDQNTANALALGALAELDLVQYRFKIRVFDYRGDSQTGLGYDIETIKVGHSCIILDPVATSDTTFWDTAGAVWDTAIWDFTSSTAINTVVTIVGLSYAWDYVDLELSAFSPNQDRAIIELRNDFETFSTA